MYRLVYRSIYRPALMTRRRQSVDVQASTDVHRPNIDRYPIDTRSRADVSVGVSTGTHDTSTIVGRCAGVHRRTSTEHRPLPDRYSIECRSFHRPSVGRHSVEYVGRWIDRHSTDDRPRAPIRYMIHQLFVLRFETIAIPAKLCVDAV